MRYLSFLLLLSIVISTGAFADDRFPHGRILVGIDAQHSRLSDDESQDLVRFDADAPGSVFQFGFMVGRGLMLRLHATGAEHATTVPDVKVLHASVSLDLLYLFREGRELRPYLCGGVGGSTLQSTRDDLTFDTTGPSMSFGLGAFWWFSDQFSLHGQARFVAVNWNQTVATLERPDGSTVTTRTWIQDSGVAGTAALGVAFRF